MKECIKFLLFHFEGRQRIFPRKMSTFRSQGKQFTIYNKEQILDVFIKSNFRDCRLNGYPVLEEGLLQAPNFDFHRFRFTMLFGKELNKNFRKNLKYNQTKIKWIRIHCSVDRKWI